jgi:sRNA-binding carbon storage regulator CsrA
MALVLKVHDFEPVYFTHNGVEFRVWVERDGRKVCVEAPESVRVERVEVRAARLARAAADTAVIPQAAICRQHAEAVAVEESDGEPD